MAERKKTKGRQKKAASISKKAETRKCWDCGRQFKTKTGRLYCPKCDKKPLVPRSGPTFTVTSRQGDITGKDSRESKYIENVKARGNHVVRRPDGGLAEVG